jgi:hypothetical protein
MGRFFIAMSLVSLGFVGVICLYSYTTVYLDAPFNKVCVPFVGADGERYWHIYNLPRHSEGSVEECEEMDRVGAQRRAAHEVLKARYCEETKSVYKTFEEWVECQKMATTTSL